MSIKDSLINPVMKGREKVDKRLKSERRIHPRIEHTLPIKLAVNGYDFTTTTQNISCLGAYCRVEKYVPPFTKLAIRMSLPVAKAVSARELDIECKGVIVRTDDADDGGFNIAIFFNGINNTQRQKISQYISRFLPK